MSFLCFQSSSSTIINHIATSGIPIPQLILIIFLLMLLPSSSDTIMDHLTSSTPNSIFIPCWLVRWKMEMAQHVYWNSYASCLKQDGNGPSFLLKKTHLACLLAFLVMRWKCSTISNKIKISLLAGLLACSLGEMEMLANHCSYPPPQDHLAPCLLVVTRRWKWPIISNPTRSPCLLACLLLRLWKLRTFPTQKDLLVFASWWDGNWNGPPFCYLLLKIILLACLVMRRVRWKHQEEERY